MSEVDFSSRGEAVAWLGKQSVEVRCAIASRAALRVLANIGRFEGNSQPALALACFRATLTSAVRGLGRTADVEWLKAAADSAARSAARSADSAARSAARSATYSADSAAHSAARSAADSADSAAHSAAYSATYSAADSAAHFAASLDAANDALTNYTTPLWPAETIPPAVEEAHQRFLKQMLDDKGTWGFWHDWYLSMWNGTFDGWDLATEVAKIPNDVWEEGKEAVAAEIRLLQAERVVEAAGINETLVFNEDTKSYNVEPHLQSNSGVLSVAVGRAEDALEDVLALGKGNGLTLETVEARILHRLFAKYREDPRRVAFDFVEVGRSITGSMKSGEYPEDSALKVLLSTLTIGVGEICVIEPDIQQELERNFPKAPDEAPSEEDRLVLTDAMLVLPEMTEDLLERQFGEDIFEVLYGVVVDYDALPDAETLHFTRELARSSIRRRLASRIGNIYLDLRKRLRAHSDSDVFKEITVVDRYGGIVAYLVVLLSAAASLIGMVFF